MEKEKTSILIHIFFIAFAAMCIIPLIMVISASFTSSDALARNGFSILPTEFDVSSYAYLFKNPKQIISAYGVTIFVTIVGTAMSLLILSMAAYVLARPNFKYKTIATWFIFFPTLFSGGLVTSYIINTQVLCLTDSIWSMILPGLVNVFQLFMIRTFMKQLPDGLFDAAKIDGAGEFRTYLSIAMPLSKPVLATIGFLGALTRWNEWYYAKLYIRSESKYPLQYLLQRIMMNIQELLRNMQNAPTMITDMTSIPGENLRMALLVVCIGPMMLVFPFFQKHFVKGMTVGSIKG